MRVNWVMLLSGILLVLVLLFYRVDKASYLTRPTGKYGVGYEDLSVVHSKLCPDGFYKKGINEIDFSKNNPNYCHEVNLRMYYPSSKHGEGDYYHSPTLRNHTLFCSSVLKLPTAVLDELKALDHIRTYAKQNSPVNQDRKFPLVIFMPGAGMPVQAYTNLMTEVASQGYIVVGVNSLFANGITELSPEHIVRPPLEYQDVGRLQSLEDLRFVLEQVEAFHYSKNLKLQMNFEQIVLMGHSMGGMSIVTLTHVMKADARIKAIVLMDPGNVLEEKNYPIQIKEGIPSLTIWSSKFRFLLKGSSVLHENNFELHLTSKLDEIDSSNHLNFSDMSTLQYHPALMKHGIREFLLNPKSLELGKDDGFELSKRIHKYITRFLLEFPFSNPSVNKKFCHTQDNNVLMFCKE